MQFGQMHIFVRMMSFFEYQGKCLSSLSEVTWSVKEIWGKLISVCDGF